MSFLTVSERSSDLKVVGREGLHDESAAALVHHLLFLPLSFSLALSLVFLYCPLSHSLPYTLSALYLSTSALSLSLSLPLYLCPSLSTSALSLSISRSLYLSLSLSLARSISRALCLSCTWSLCLSPPLLSRSLRSKLAQWKLSQWAPEGLLCWGCSCGCHWASGGVGAGGDGGSLGLTTSLPEMVEMVTFRYELLLYC